MPLSLSLMPLDCRHFHYAIRCARCRHTASLCHIQQADEISPPLRIEYIVLYYTILRHTTSSRYRHFSAYYYAATSMRRRQYYASLFSTPLPFASLDFDAILPRRYLCIAATLIATFIATHTSSLLIFSSATAIIFEIITLTLRRYVDVARHYC